MEKYHDIIEIVLMAILRILTLGKRGADTPQKEKDGLS